MNSPNRRVSLSPSVKMKRGSLKITRARSVLEAKGWCRGGTGGGADDVYCDEKKSESRTKLKSKAGKKNPRDECRPISSKFRAAERTEWELNKVVVRIYARNFQIIVVLAGDVYVQKSN